MQCLRRIARGLQQQQIGAGVARTFKDLPVRPNPHVERWYNAREDMEMTATITGRMLAQGFFWESCCHTRLMKQFASSWNPRNRSAARTSSWCQIMCLLSQRRAAQRHNVRPASTVCMAVPLRALVTNHALRIRLLKL